MIIKNKSLDERCLEIYEEDIVGGNEILILSVYCTRINDGLWQFPQPQIYNETIYAKYKEKYDEQILAFRNDCESLEGEKGSIVSIELDNLKQEIELTQNALNELLFSKEEV